jgi:hypothetical protein
LVNSALENTLYTVPFTVWVVKKVNFRPFRAHFSPSHDSLLSHVIFFFWILLYFLFGIQFSTKLVWVFIQSFSYHLFFRPHIYFQMKQHHSKHNHFSINKQSFFFIWNMWSLRNLLTHNYQAYTTGIEHVCHSSRGGRLITVWNSKYVHGEFFHGTLSRLLA